MHETIIQVLLLLVGGLLCVLQTAAIMLFRGQGARVEEICKENEKDHAAMCTKNEKAHDELWRHFNHHKHTHEGEVVITRGVDA